MSYRILLFEKTKEEYERYACNYESLKLAIDVMNGILSSRGHVVSSVFNLCDLTDELYRSQNVVFAHPTIDKFQRVLGLYRRYPEVGLIITSGSGKDEGVCHDLAQLEDGLLFLEKPFSVKTLLDSVEMAIKQSTRRVLDYSTISA